MNNQKRTRFELFNNNNNKIITIKSKFITKLDYKIICQRGKDTMSYRHRGKNSWFSNKIK